MLVVVQRCQLLLEGYAFKQGDTWAHEVIEGILLQKSRKAVVVAASEEDVLAVDVKDVHFKVGCSTVSYDSTKSSM